MEGIAGDLGLNNPLTSQFGHLSLQDKAFLDAFNRQEQQELHGVPRPGPVDPNTLLGQLEQVTSQLTQSRLQRQGSVQSAVSSTGSASGSGSGLHDHDKIGAGQLRDSASGHQQSGVSASANQPRHHEIVNELSAEEVRNNFV